MIRAIDVQPGGKLPGIARLYPGAEAKALMPAIDAGDADATEIFESTMTDLAFGLSHVVHPLSSRHYNNRRRLSLMGETLRKKVEEELKRYIMDAFQPGPASQL